MQNSTFWNGMKVSMLIIGTTIGAGFASGREIWEFFSSYGRGSGIYIIVSMILFSVCCYIIMSISQQLQAVHYVHVLESIIGPTLARVYDVLIVVYLMSTTVVMFAGSGATVEHWSIPYWWGVVGIGLLVLLVFMRDVKGIVSLNTILIPILIATLVTVCIVFLVGEWQSISLPRSQSPLLPSSLAFTALNILPLIAVLSVVGASMKKEEIRIASISSAIGLCSVGLLYNEALLRIGDEIKKVDVPLFALLQHFSEELMVGVGIVLWLAIFTTAISGVLGLVSRCREIIKKPQWLIAAGWIVLLLPLTEFGFTRLIQVLYPLYGVLNLFVFAALLLYPLANRKRLG